MANVKITINGVLMDGHEVTFKAPCDCSAFEHLDVHYVENQTQKNKLFTMKDAHGNSLTGIGNLFAKGAYVHAILNTVDGVAYLQNGDTNGYLEEKFGSLSGEITDLNGNNAGAHNAIYRGKNLGSAVTEEQYTAIANGTFDDLYIGDYWTINDVNWRIAGFDYYWNSGDGATNSNCTTHHVVIVPDTCLCQLAMNSSNTNSGGYVGSWLYTTGLEDVKSNIKAIFSGHVLSHRIYLNNSTSSGVWRDSEVDLMNEHMLYGTGIFYTRSGAQHRVEKSQLPLFAHEPSRINIRDNYWLRDITDSSKFAYFAIDGIAGTQVASAEYGIRPFFCIC